MQLNVQKTRRLLLSNSKMSQLQVIQVNLIRVNYGSPGAIVLSTAYHKPDSSGNPLSYLIREAQEPLDNAVYDDFMEEMVACAPLSGQTYDNDRRLVHQDLMGFITVTLSEDYVRKTYTRGRCHNNSRTSFQALRQQYEAFRLYVNSMRDAVK